MQNNMVLICLVLDIVLYFTIGSIYILVKLACKT